MDILLSFTRPSNIVYDVNYITDNLLTWSLAYETEEKGIWIIGYGNKTKCETALETFINEIEKLTRA
jgi:hypothetical protein